MTINNTEENGNSSPLVRD